MKRRPSGSATEDDEPPALEASPTHGKNDQDGRNVVKGAKKASHKKSKGKSGRKSSGPVAQSTNNPPEVWVPSPVASATSEKPLAKDITSDDMAEYQSRRRARLRSPWACSPLTLATTIFSAVLLLTIVRSFLTRQLDPKGCEMSYMRAAFAKFSDFDTEHTRFASKYSLYLYREGGIDEDTRVKGIPVLFIPGNAGSYKQVRPLAAEAAYHFHDVLRHDQNAIKNGKRALDFFSVDFNEDITAFHGQTLLDQAEYLNEAVAYILSLYHNPRRSIRDSELPDPSSVILVGHSMGGVVARTMLTMPNYQSNTINTILTLSAPHARAPVSFDVDIVKAYKRINDYWRDSYSEKWANSNPLWHVTLISIAGGGLDTVVPSDYSSLASLVPETHGFTVFTSSIPNVWTGMDHLAIMWCDQLRKVVVKALYDVVDVGRPSQTRPRAERMRSFKKWFLTGMEEVAEKTLLQKEPKTLLTLEDNSNSITPHGERLTLRSLGQARKAKAHLLPIPPQGTPEGRKFTFLTDQKLDSPGDTGKLEVLFCSVFPLQAGQSAMLFSVNMDLSGDSTGSTRLACKNAASDVISLPASTRESKNAFDHASPFSYLQYQLEDLADYHLVAVVDKATEPAPGWVVAEFSASFESAVQTDLGLRRLMSSGLHLELPNTRPMVTEIKIPAAQSALLSYKLVVGSQACGDETGLFTPLVRQYISEPYESKYFVNVKEANISLHGTAPYMPPSLTERSSANGLSLQIWSDPTCNNTMEVLLKVDFMGSVGKLVMRYRTVFAAFPLLVVGLVLRKQFKVYDESGVFMSFSESMDQCLRTSLPVFFLALTFFAMSLASTSYGSRPATHGLFNWRGNATAPAVDFTKNDLLLGSADPFFWFLVPLFGLISVGVCIALNYAALGVTHIFTLAYIRVKSVSLRSDEGRRTAAAFAVTSPWQRIIITLVLVLLVSTVIPYQFAYMVLCVVQIATCTRALRLALETRSGTNYNFYNYAHSLLVLMLWILPINLPVLVVWMRNLSVHWLTPFSSHHNILAITPYILLVETLSTGAMVPRLAGRARHLTNVLLFAGACYAAVYGVTYAYRLHHAVNVLCAWLVAIHVSAGGVSRERVGKWLEGAELGDGHVKKRP